MSTYQIRLEPRRLFFRQPAGTSRGVYRTRDVYYLHLSRGSDPTLEGIGECAPLPDLSAEAGDNFLPYLKRLVDQVNQTGALPSASSLRRDYPSILFALETALRHLERQSWALWDTAFSRSEVGITINGLIWMGDYKTMLERIDQKISIGCRCIKMKIGAIDFEQELDLLQHIRRHFSSKEVELRVDANGAFAPDKALDYLRRLAELDLHSIEQPIKAGQWETLAGIVAQSPLDIALDEELIGINDTSHKIALLDSIQPHYIILKPTLHGGWSGSDEWISLAQERGIGWWATSALESNIGLNAIAQWCARYDNPLPQGLGTGQLFVENIDLPLVIKGDELWYGTR